MAYACRVRLAVAGPSLALTALFAAAPGAYAVDAAPAPQSAAAPRSTPTTPPSGLAGRLAGEGRPHPGRDADQEELGAGTDSADHAGSRTGRDQRDQQASPEDPADPQDAVPRDGDPENAVPGDPVTPQDPAAPVNPVAPRADGSVPRTALAPGSETAPGSEHGSGSGSGGLAGESVAPAVPPVRGDAPHTTSPPFAVPRPDWTAPAAVPHASAPPYEQAAEPPTGRVLRVLPFGTGLALLGAGLGVLAVRLRRR